jgi:hypothetical protein
MVQLVTLRRALTNRLSVNSTSEVVLEVRWGDPHVVKSIVSLSYSDIVFFWHQFMTMGNDNLDDPKILHRCVSSVAEWVNHFWLIDEKARKSSNPIVSSGRSLLRAFGKMLFSISVNETNGFEHCRAVALGALCQIFCNCPSSEFTLEEIGRFYDIVILALGEMTDKPTVMEIIKQCGTLFSSSLPGSRILVPHFFQHMRRIYDKNASQILINLRASVLKILGTLLPVKATFSTLEDSNDTRSKLIAVNTHHLLSIPLLLQSVLTVER